MSVFIIMNEWTAIDGSTGAEVVGANYFEIEQDAWDSLRDIATALDVELLPGDSNLSLEDHVPSLQFEEYYIEELTRL